jgi:hypothetical protein
MLGNARLAVEEGVDLVIGYLEAQGPSRTSTGSSSVVRRGRDV